MRKPIGTRKEQVLYMKTSTYMNSALAKAFKEETARQRILHLLFIYPLEEFSLSEIAEQGKVSKSTASRIILSLQKEELITLVRHRLVWRIQANYTNPHYKQEKILYNIALIYRTGIVQFLDESFRRPKNIILFGSYRNGEDWMDSDIDIAIEGEKQEILRIKDLKGLESQLGRRIVIHRFNRKSIDRNLFINIANGIVLSGFLEVKP